MLGRLAVAAIGNVPIQSRANPARPMGWVQPLSQVRSCLGFGIHRLLPVREKRADCSLLFACFVQAVVALDGGPLKRHFFRETPCSSC